MTNILLVNSSGRNEGSYSRKLCDELISKLQLGDTKASVVERDVARGIEFVDQEWIAANFTPQIDRSKSQHSRLAGSDILVAEVQAADSIVIALPIYNFSVPGTLKSWIDQICRAGVTFKYSDTGPIGLLEGKSAYLVVTSGGTEVQGPVDFATDYMLHVLDFIGINDVTLVNAGQLMADENAALALARATIEKAA